MKRLVLIPLAVAGLFVSGCSTSSEPRSAPATPEIQASPKTDSTPIEGVWKGREVTPGHDGAATLTFSGQTLEYHGADPDDWVKGTFALREDTSPKQLVSTVTECVAPEQVGKISDAIYKIEDGTLTISGSALGDANFPSGFDAPGAREFIFKRVQ